MCAVFSNWTTWPRQASTRRNTAGCSNYNSSAPHVDVQLRSWNDGSVFLGIKQWLQYFEINQNWALSGTVETSRLEYSKKMFFRIVYHRNPLDI